MHIQRDAHARWKGIVMIIRCDLSKISEGEKAMCRVVSKKDPDLGYRRAVAEEMPYEMFSHLFSSDDGDAIECYAEVSASGEGFHLEVHERASKREFFLHAPQVTGAVPAH